MSRVEPEGQDEPGAFSAKKRLSCKLNPSQIPTLDYQTLTLARLHTLSPPWLASVGKGEERNNEEELVVHGTSWVPSRRRGDGPDRQECARQGLPGSGHLDASSARTRTMNGNLVFLSRDRLKQALLKPADPSEINQERKKNFSNTHERRPLGT